MEFTVHVIGAGGTGSYFLKEFCRFASGNKDIGDIYIYDGDRVEQNNLTRQCFIEEDIGKNKALVMAELLTEAFSVKCCAVPRYLTKKEQIIETNRIPLLVGCVDNHAARLVLEEYFREKADCILFDSANEYETGEVVFAYRFGNMFVGRERSFYFPDIKKETKDRTEMSCTDLNDVAPQHIVTNMLAANHLLAGVANLLEGVVHPGFTLFNSLRLDCQFVPYPKENVSGGETK